MPVQQPPSRRLDPLAYGFREPPTTGGSLECVLPVHRTPDQTFLIGSSVVRSWPGVHCRPCCARSGPSDRRPRMFLVTRMPLSGVSGQGLSPGDGTDARLCVSWARPHRHRPRCGDSHGAHRSKPTSRHSQRAGASHCRRISLTASARRLRSTVYKTGPRPCTTTGNLGPGSACWQVS